MKQAFKIPIFIILLIANSSCHTQQIVQTSNDAKILENNETKYISKPLKILLADIKPDIKLFFTERRNDSKGTISFYFVDHPKFVELSKKNVKITRLIVHVTGVMSENNFTLPLEQRFDWTPEYKKKNADLVVKRIIVRVGDE